MERSPNSLLQVFRQERCKYGPRNSLPFRGQDEHRFVTGASCFLIHLSLRKVGKVAPDVERSTNSSLQIFRQERCKYGSRNSLPFRCPYEHRFLTGACWFRQAGYCNRLLLQLSLREVNKVAPNMERSPNSLLQVFRQERCKYGPRNSLPFRGQDEHRFVTGASCFLIHLSLRKVGKVAPDVERSTNSSLQIFRQERCKYGSRNSLPFRCPYEHRFLTGACWFHCSWRGCMDWRNYFWLLHNHWYLSFRFCSCCLCCLQLSPQRRGLLPSCFQFDCFRLQSLVRLALDCDDLLLGRSFCCLLCNFLALTKHHAHTCYRFGRLRDARILRMFRGADLFENFLCKDCFRILLSVKTLPKEGHLRGL